MSLILDALKKAEAQKAEAQKVEIPPASVVPEQKQNVMPPLSGDIPHFGLKPKRKAPITTIALIVAVIFGGGYVARKQFKAYEESKLTTNVKPKIKEFTIQKTKLDSDGSETVDTQKIMQLKEQATAKFQDGSGHYEESAKLYEKLVELAPLDAEIFNNYGVVLKRLGRLDESKSQYLQALALTENKYPEALNNLAVLYITQNNYREAKESLIQAVELNPDYVDAYLHLALCQEKMNELPEAIKNYEKFLALSYGKFDRKIRLQVESRISRLSGG